MKLQITDIVLQPHMYMREADSLRALPQLDSFQAQRLAALEKTIANLQGTLKNAPQKTR